MERRIGKYAIKKKLGQGAFGQVYLVVDAQGRKYAAKVMQMSRQQILAQLQEALLQLSMEHRYVLKARDTFLREEEGQMVIIMDYCEQGNLADIIGHGKLRKHGEIAQRLMLEITTGLKYIHDCNIVHRDLKPENIMLKEHHPQISDYGLSKLVTNANMTMGVGTPFYFAPELLRSDHYDQSVDIWSLGIIFLELLLDKRIFKLLQGIELPCRRQNFPSREMLQALPNNNARNMIIAMLKRNPDDRPGVDELIQFLQSKDVFKEEAVEITLEIQKKRDIYVVGTDEGMFIVGVERLEIVAKETPPKERQSPPKAKPQPAKPQPRNKQADIPLSPRPGAMSNIPTNPKPRPTTNPKPRPTTPVNIIAQMNEQQTTPRRPREMNEPLLRCPGCSEKSNSVVRTKIGTPVWGWFVCLLFTCPFLSVCPFLFDKCKDKEYVCVDCGYVQDYQKGEWI